jgi:hypothetical protein
MSKKLTASRVKKEQVQMVSVYCGACNAMHGTFLKKEIPKSFICTNCGVGQQVTYPQGAGFTHKRNYPEGYFG